MLHMILLVGGFCCKSCFAFSVARFLESRGMLEDALEVATDPDYKFDLAIQLGNLEIAKVRIFYSYG